MIHDCHLSCFYEHASRRFPAAEGQTRSFQMCSFCIHKKKKTWGKKCKMRHLRAAALLVDYTSSLNLKPGKYSVINAHFQRWAVIRASSLLITSPVEGAIRTRLGLSCGWHEDADMLMKPGRNGREAARRGVCILLQYHSSIWGETNANHHVPSSSCSDGPFPISRLFSRLTLPRINVEDHRWISLGCDLHPHWIHVLNKHL